MTGQPNIPNWEFDIEKIEVIETGGTAPGVIINQPNEFMLQTTIKNAGMGWPLHNEMGSVSYHAQKLEDGTVATLTPTPFTMGTSEEHTVASPTFASGPGKDLDVGTWLTTVYVRFANEPARSNAAAFNQTLIMVF
jgi:hypothetical protein